MIITLIGLCICIAVTAWSVATLMKAKKSYKEEADRLQKTRMTLASASRTFHVAYTFSDHDLMKYGNDKQGMQKNALNTMSAALGRKIVRVLKPEEVVAGGVLVGYKIDVEALKMPWTENHVGLDGIESTKI